jgi:prolyl-tRNA synthetase
MRWSQTFIPTLREDPAEAEVPSHRLLLRAGYVRQVAAGVYAHLLLAQKSFFKIAQIIREEMNRIGGQEFYLPALNPAELWKESGRYEAYGPTMFKFKDRNDHDMCLGVTHEEEMTNIARGEIRSYKQLPQIWYQIQEKFRDEPRPKAGLLRLRQFWMKDSYSFDLDDAGLDVSYRKHYDAYCRIFDRCGLKYVIVEAYSGTMGGTYSHEFVALTDAGEDSVIVCECGYAANLEKAEAKAPPVEDPPGDAPPEAFPTPGQKTIDDLAKFTGEGPTRLMKTLVYIVESQPVVILLRGDHSLSETKLASTLGTETFRPATPEEALALHGAHLGSLGPVGLKGVRILADRALEGRKNLITGANRDDFHLRHVTPGRDFQAEYHDLRVVVPADQRRVRRRHCDRQRDEHAVGHHERHDQQDMYQASGHMEAEAEKPQDQQNYKDCPKHTCLQCSRHRTAGFISCARWNKPAGAQLQSLLVSLRDGLALGTPDCIEERPGCARRSDLPRQRGSRGDFLSVHGASGIVILADRRSVQRDASERTLGA